MPAKPTRAALRAQVRAYCAAQGCTYREAVERLLRLGLRSHAASVIGGTRRWLLTPDAPEKLAQARVARWAGKTPAERQALMAKVRAARQGKKAR